MSAEIVNLRQARKRKVRSEREVQAQDNRLKFGRTKAEKQAAKHERAVLEKTLDGHRLSASDNETPDAPTSSAE
ncbi:DUF4169 family protein [uncultured Salinisphaera sp.]|uniref:DUF4169 family protein n=1 Tax=uncultured Salinisphaera sp. TaxID=359372 RepID=UPI0032B117ED